MTDFQKFAAFHDINIDVVKYKNNTFKYLNMVELLNINIKVLELLEHLKKFRNEVIFYEEYADIVDIQMRLFAAIHIVNNNSSEEHEDYLKIVKMSQVWYGDLKFGI